ncbi:helix-turn-helix domain-containing protein [Spongiactinospora sp. 9N601]|uniref:helix-turn-helix domain-containing protein n=1 Tax=Spongiactinospora sp. 9N601 TaxID=3375149 RepID=UPI00378DCA6A
MADTSPTVRRRRLAAELRRLRKESGLTSEYVAQQVGLAQSWMSRVESGRQGIRLNDLRVLLDIYHVPTDQREELMTLARQSRQRGWWHSYGDAIPEWFQVRIGLEAEATRLRSYTVELIPGLLQTADYYRRLLISQYPTSGSNDIERMIDFRLARQERLVGNESQDLSFIINEACLHRLRADPETSRGQLARLTKLAELPNVDLRVLPFSAGMHTGIDGGFVLLGFAPPDPDVVYIEYRRNSLFLEDATQVESYNCVYRDLHEASLSREETHVLLTGFAKSAAG